MLALRRRGPPRAAARRRAPGLPPPGLVGRDRRGRGRGPRGRDRAPGAGAERHRRALRRTWTTPDTVHLGERERDPGERAAIAGTDDHRRWICPRCAPRAPSRPRCPYWLHVDADVLDLPAVDSPAPGGLSFAELTRLLRAVVDGRGRRPGHGLRPRPGRGRLAGARADGLPRRRLRALRLGLDRQVVAGELATLLEGVDLRGGGCGSTPAR